MLEYVHCACFTNSIPSHLLAFTASSNLLATSNTSASVRLPPISVTAKGSFVSGLPSTVSLSSLLEYVPAGTEIPVRSKTFPKCVNVPRTVFVTIGSARTSSMVQCVGADGTTTRKGPHLLDAKISSACLVNLEYVNLPFSSLHCGNQHTMP
jgi:hypothetical protein